MAETQWSSYYDFTVDIDFYQRFLYYSDYYAYAAQSGRISAQKIYPSVVAAGMINIYTFDNFEQASIHLTSLTNSLINNYEILFSNMQSLGPINGSFTGLANHIKDKTMFDSVDEFLSVTGIQVAPTYASISTLVGDTISEENIR